MLRMIVSAVVLLSVVAVSAVEFDTDLYCKDASKEAADREAAETSCRQREKAAQAKLANSTIPEAVEQKCSPIAKGVGGSYVVMEQCVREREAEKDRE